MTIKRLQIEHKSDETLRVGLISRNDPVGGGGPKFQLTDADADDPVDANWTAGTWEGPWDPVSGAIVAISPVTNSVAAMTLVEHTTMKVWINWTHGTESPIKQPILLDVK